jgi:bifunctional N-acetylglucosamine-1-phosphate-uridyltransferase/glucosamine-1-phosphate-acetyltransferase GlmU-like protein
VEIGDEAVVGAGSVITENVAAQEMAMTRVEQKNLAQAGKRFREKRRDAGGK